MSQDLTLAPATGNRPTGFLTFTLHAHLPWVINHGTWPHGIEWLHEAAAETYLPLLRALANLERDGIALHCNLILTPILLEQLAHPIFRAEFPNYVQRKIGAAREDESFFLQANDHHLAEAARSWQRFYTQALDDFNALNQDIIAAFRHFHEAGLIHLITSAATHSYLPLLGTDESLRAQIRTAVDAHTRHIGSAPQGIWSPECGYRPAGRWSYPVSNADGSVQPQPFQRIGLEQALAESDLDFFVVDAHLVEAAEHRPASPDLQTGVPLDDKSERLAHAPHRTLYQPYFVTSPNATPAGARCTATAFPRDPRTALQVWSHDNGYPGDANYLDFHKKRFPGGHRYWRVTGPHVEIGDKHPYSPNRAAERIESHASHFVSLVYETLKPSFSDSVPPILCAPFDAELFGHWWFEGPQWLEAVARILHERRAELPISLTSCAEYLDSYPRAGVVALPEGSWGAEGDHQVWLNPETSWTYGHIYSAELALRDLATRGGWSDSPLGTRILKQLCRELLLLESSDWQSLITTGAARDYAEIRFLTHNDQFNDLKAIYHAWEAAQAISPAEEIRLAAIEQRDSIFPHIDPAHWIQGSHAKRGSFAQEMPSDPTQIHSVARTTKS